MQKLIDGAISLIAAPTVLGDGVMTQACEHTNAYPVVLEARNEIGTANSDPSHQGAFAYRKYWASDTHDLLRSKCYCPSIILAIAGPWLCVLGGVYLEQVVVQPITDYLWLGGDAFNDSRIFSVGRIFNALKSAVSALRQYYSPNVINAHDKPDGFPFIRFYGREKFLYLEKLAEYPKLIYKAKLQSSEQLLVVKFVSKYNAEAHRLLAENQLAPALHYVGMEDTGAPKYGGRYMIVMDFVEGEHPSNFLSKDAADRIKKAVNLLHSQNFVFGDLRLPNILITKEGSMLVDFDWCSPADKGRYPMSLNQESGIDWAEGMGPDCAMEQKHNLDMLEKMCYRPGG
ncbi:hypothetical protein K439DRAFT_251562 [Ramaria rubella]|nr:hypothetical protein K439DRAFT_251562 [Ramaria rubella]